MFDRGYVQDVVKAWQETNPYKDTGFDILDVFDQVFLNVTFLWVFLQIHLGCKANGYDGYDHESRKKDTIHEYRTLCILSIVLCTIEEVSQVCERGKILTVDMVVLLFNRNVFYFKQFFEVLIRKLAFLKV